MLLAVLDKARSRVRPARRVSQRRGGMRLQSPGAIRVSLRLRVERTTALPADALFIAKWGSAAKCARCRRSGASPKAKHGHEARLSSERGVRKRFKGDVELRRPHDSDLLRRVFTTTDTRDVGVASVAGGSGTRAGGTELKQFRWAAGKPGCCTAANLHVAFRRGVSGVLAARIRRRSAAVIFQRHRPALLSLRAPHAH